MLDFDPRGAKPENSASSGALGNPASASASVSVGLGGLILLGLAAYGIYRLAKG